VTTPVRFAVIDPFPQLSNAETEVIKRLEIASKRIGVECVVIDPEGYVRGTKRRLEEVYERDEIAFVISLHFSTPKITRHFTYHAAWNPPEFLGFAWEYNFSVENMLTCDDFLTYDSFGINTHLESLLAPFARTLEGTSHLATGCAGDIYPPNAERIKNGKLFYCGMNWERLGGKGRHHEIFRILDAHPDRVAFYGPEKFQGIAPWGGYKCYAGEIPFDGIAMVDTIRECGLALALSADAHRESEAASNRVFESCAAGAFIISDDNPFLLRTFGDAIYKVAYKPEKPQETAEGILEAVNWAKSHLEEAAAMAARCQEIYAKKYTYEGQLTDIIARHPLRQQALGAFEGAELSVVVAYAEKDEQGLRKTLQSLMKQIQPVKEIIVTCPYGLSDDVLEISGALEMTGVHIAAMPENFKRANFYMPLDVPSTGDLLVAVLPEIKSEYLSILLAGQEWSDIHGGANLRHLKDSSADLLVAGAQREIPDQDGKFSRINREFLCSAPNRLVELITNQIQPLLGAMMFKTTLLRGLPNANLRFMDNNFLGSLILLQGLCTGKVVFGGRLTVSQAAYLHKKECKAVARHRTWQVWHMHDALRNIAAWPILRATFMHPQSHSIFSHYPQPGISPFSRRTIDGIKKILAPYPPLFNLAAKVLVWWRQQQIERSA
jgi:hypothetical protein